MHALIKREPRYAELASICKVKRRFSFVLFVNPALWVLSSGNFAYSLFVLQKLMGNVLLHLEEDERLDINCTQLLNNEVGAHWIRSEIALAFYCDLICWSSWKQESLFLVYFPIMSWHHFYFVLFLQLVLLGAEEGLYSLSLDGPGKHAPRMLPGVERAFQMDVVSDLNLVIMIAGTSEL